ncbi:MAG: ergothioneine biosynthesis protein EgtB [Acidobacteria bacterium]|nr:ergothioneine biosynthesis protein EgtB [Acidobacteriota bacterium]
MAAPAQLDSPGLVSRGLAERYSAVRGWTEKLAEGLSPEDQMVQSCFEASPVKWHRAHTSWFFETFLLAPHLAGYCAVDERFRYLFNSYYDHVGERPERGTRGMISRPDAAEIAVYRRRVDEAMQQLLLGDGRPEIAQLVELGLNHEQQHQELMVTDIKHAFWTNPLRPAYWATRETAANSTAAAAEWLEFEGGVAEAGHGGEGFAFDNERPRHRVLLNDFLLGGRLVTNGEYMQFMADGGYATPTLWLSEGWEAVRTNRWQAPLYWEERDGKWFCFTCGGMRELDADEPVSHVSLFEADAYARWRGARLATEFEWEHAAARESEAAARGNLLEREHLHPAPACGSAQFFGDCWEWTSSSYGPYPGFRPAAGALGEYNGKFMCNQYVLRGGSCATPQSHIRPSYRNFFPAVTRWQFSGIRLAKDGGSSAGAAEARTRGRA